MSDHNNHRRENEVQKLKTKEYVESLLSHLRQFYSISHPSREDEITEVTTRAIVAIDVLFNESLKQKKVIEDLNAQLENSRKAYGNLKAVRFGEAYGVQPSDMRKDFSKVDPVKRIIDMDLSKMEAKVAANQTDKEKLLSTNKRQTRFHRMRHTIEFLKAKVVSLEDNERALERIFDKKAQHIIDTISKNITKNSALDENSAQEETKLQKEAQPDERLNKLYASLESCEERYEAEKVVNLDLAFKISAIAEKLEVQERKIEVREAQIIKRDSLIEALRARLVEPIDMVIFCPNCHAQHIDEPSEDWTNPPHHRHLCEDCGHEFAVSKKNTNGVLSLFKEKKK